LQYLSEYHIEYIFNFLHFRYYSLNQFNIHFFLVLFQELFSDKVSTSSLLELSKISYSILQRIKINSSLEMKEFTYELFHVLADNSNLNSYKNLFNLIIQISRNSPIFSDDNGYDNQGYPLMFHDFTKLVMELWF
jgi:hypothetical protein